TDPCRGQCHLWPTSGRGAELARDALPRQRRSARLLVTTAGQMQNPEECPDATRPARLAANGSPGLGYRGLCPLELDVVTKLERRRNAVLRRGVLADRVLCLLHAVLQDHRDRGAQLAAPVVLDPGSHCS